MEQFDRPKDAPPKSPIFSRGGKYSKAYEALMRMYTNPDGSSINTPDPSRAGIGDFEGYGLTDDDIAWMLQFFTQHGNLGNLLYEDTPADMTDERWQELQRSVQQKKEAQKELGLGNIRK